VSNGIPGGDKQHSRARLQVTYGNLTAGFQCLDEYFPAPTTIGRRRLITTIIKTDPGQCKGTAAQLGAARPVIVAALIGPPDKAASEIALAP
jgi:hypothetical protein